jgi:hypothetical protein
MMRSFPAVEAMELGLNVAGGAVKVLAKLRVPVEGRGFVQVTESVYCGRAFWVSTPFTRTSQLTVTVKLAMPVTPT